MFDWIGSMLDGILSTYVLGVVSALMSALTPLALTAMTLWVMVFGWAVVRGEVAEAIPAFLWKTFKIGVVLAFGLQSGFYISNVADTANNLAMGVASTLLPSGVDPATVTTPYALLDKFNDQASAQVADIMKEASIVRLDLVLAAIVFSFGSVIFLCIALFIVTLAKLLLTFVIAIGPLFILCLAWRPTQRFFDSWLSMLLNAVVLTWFAFFALGLSNFAGIGIFKAIHDGGGFLGGAFNVLGEATRYCILMLLMAIICFQAPSLTSALTGGAAVQQGIQMIQNAMMVSGLRSAASSRSAGTGTGGQVRAGASIPYLAGQAAGVTAAGGQRMARQAYSATRTAAYKLAALRGSA
ncbi:conjugal transfer protein TrbL [Paucibacter sp. KBW04]|uniref:type IV secretion system protein n=1 Tax=Paucibacter sp. KBW04 TaxID=2153361 RepID=UPI000F573A0C|nr:type IV secretion system protein [Paucibacter sp. KBW04]RQO53238.1 conjugal transfer protein TrbL [Paucibacter sp. KBW04]